MRRLAGVLALVVLLAALGVGGFFLVQGRLPWEAPPAPPAPPPAPAATPAPPPEDLPPPVLSGQAGTGEPVATLVGAERTVKSKRAADLVWEDAQKNMPLYEDDAIRTFEKASASIAFGPDDLVEVDQNALVVIKPRGGRHGPDEEISLALLSGDLLDSLAAKPAPEQQEAIKTAAASRQLTLARVPAPAGGRPAKTRVALKSMPDRSTSVAVISGTLRLRPAKGPEVVLREKTVTKVGPEGLMAKPRDLPGVPEIVFPEDGATYAFQRKVPRVDLRWKPAERARSYRVVVATDSAFRRIFADERVSGTTFTVGNLQPGQYYWRVRAQDGDGFEGAYSGVRTVRAAHDDDPPALAILSPPEMFVAPAPQVEVRGKTEKAARVKVNGQKASVGPDGTFTFPLALKEGVNLVSIEAIDPAGNSQYGRRLITYKGAKRSAAASVTR